MVDTKDPNYAPGPRMQKLLKVCKELRELVVRLALENDCHRGRRASGFRSTVLSNSTDGVIFGIDFPD
jgi:hypothetical protein